MLYVTQTSLCGIPLCCCYCCSSSMWCNTVSLSSTPPWLLEGFLNLMGVLVGDRVFSQKRNGISQRFFKCCVVVTIIIAMT